MMAKVLSEKDFRAMMIVLCICLSIIPTLFYRPSINGVILTQGGKYLCANICLTIYEYGRFNS